jgi:hypothetical protein
LSRIGSFRATQNQKNGLCSLSSATVVSEPWLVQIKVSASSVKICSRAICLARAYDCLPRLIGLSGLRFPFLRPGDQSFHILRPVVKRGWIKVRAVRPNQRVDFGIDFYRIEYG